MSRGTEVCASLRERFPRVSGDEPGERDPIERYGVFSPREWG